MYGKEYLVGWGKKLLGVILIIGGFFGLFLPFLQGIAMIIAGAMLLENKFILDKAYKFVAYVKNWRKK